MTNGAEVLDTMIEAAARQPDAEAAVIGAVTLWAARDYLEGARSEEDVTRRRQAAREALLDRLEAA